MSHLHALHLTALIWVAATGSIVEAREARSPKITPAISTHVEIRAIEGGFAIYSFPPLGDIQPARTMVSLGSSVRIDASLLTLPAPEVGNVVR